MYCATSGAKLPKGAELNKEEGKDGLLLGFSEKQALLLILALAAALRFFGSNAELWFDEIVSVQYYFRPPLSEIIRNYSSANNHVMNSVLAHIFINLFGEKAWVVRLPSILFGIGGVWAFYFLTVRFWEKNVAMAGTLLFAVSFPNIYFTQNARGYSAFLFFAMVAGGALIRLTADDKPKRAGTLGALYAVSIGLGMYTQMLMGFVIIGHGLALIWTRKGRELAWLAGGIGLGLVLYAPMLSEIVGYFTGHSIVGASLFSKEFLRMIMPVLPLLILGPIVLAAPLIRFWRRSRLTAALIILPMVFNIFLPTLLGQAMYPRFLIYGLALGYIIFLEGVDMARGRFPRMAWSGVAVVLIVTMLPLFKFYSLPKQGFHQALKYIEANRESGDRVIGLTLGGKAARYYDSSLKLVENMQQLREELDSGNGRVWTLFTFIPYLRSGTPVLYEWVQQETVAKAVFPGVIRDGEVTVRLWTPAVAP